MGEYTMVVWAAYLIALLVLGGISIASIRGLQKAKRALSQLGEKGL